LISRFRTGFELNTLLLCSTDAFTLLLALTFLTGIRLAAALSLSGIRGWTSLAGLRAFGTAPLGAAACGSSSLAAALGSDGEC
jgi:hypothetical protein